MEYRTKYFDNGVKLTVIKSQKTDLLNCIKIVKTWALTRHEKDILISIYKNKIKDLNEQITAIQVQKQELEAIAFSFGSI